jgi:hypothetical protein
LIVPQHPVRCSCVSRVSDLSLLMAEKRLNMQIDSVSVRRDIPAALPPQTVVLADPRSRAPDFLERLRHVSNFHITP